MQYRHLGVMLDCSRNAVMNERTLRRVIDLLAKLGYNTLELYTEDTFEVDGEPYFGYLRGRYTQAELRSLDAYAKEKGVELIPCIQTLAHFTNTSRLPVYEGLWDTGDVLLVGEERTYAFIENLFKSVRACFSSKHINIGMDEAHFVGLGEYLNRHGYENRFDILLSHLRRVAKIAEKYGFEAHMWSDMFTRLANGGGCYGRDIVIPKEVAQQLPDNVEPCYWDYYHTEIEDYDAMFKTHEVFGKNVWFAGCLWGWCSFAPCNIRTLRNMKPAVQSAIKHGVKDVLLAFWGDNGGECSFFSMLPSLYTLRQYADGNFDEESIERGFYQTFGVEREAFMTLDLANQTPSNRIEDPLINPCKAMLYNDPLMGIMDAHYEREGGIDFKGYADTIADVGRRAGEYGYLFETLSKLCAALAVKAELGIRARKTYRSGDLAGLHTIAEDFDRAIALVEEFYLAFEGQWQRENKAFGLEIHQARIGGAIFRMKNVARKLRAYFAGELSRIEELEEEILEYSADGVWCEKYAHMISTSAL